MERASHLLFTLTLSSVQRILCLCTEMSLFQLTFLLHSPLMPSALSMLTNTLIIMPLRLPIDCSHSTNHWLILPSRGSLHTTCTRHPPQLPDRRLQARC